MSFLSRLRSSRESVREDDREADRARERRSRSKQQKTALFYDSKERTRLWRIVAGLILVIVALVGLLGASLVGNVVLFARAAKVIPFLIAVHDDGSVIAMGPIDPAHAATTKELRRDAMTYIDKLFTVTIPTEQEELKELVLIRTDDGSDANRWVDEFYRDKKRSPFWIYKKGFQAVANLRCHDDTETRFTCWFNRVPVNGLGHEIGSSVAYTAHLTIVQDRENSADETLLYRNPNETYVKEFDAAPDDPAAGQ